MAVAASQFEDRLRRTPLFSALDGDQLASVLASARVRDLADGERLFDFGQPAGHFFYVVEGEIKLFRSSAEGAEKVIEIIRGGQTFAEAVMFMSREAPTYPVSAQAIFATRVIAFENAALRRILEASSEVCLRMMGSMSIWLHRFVDEIDRLSLHNASYRFAVYLLGQIPEGVERAPEIVLTTPKNVIASRLGIQPETFSRIESRMVRDGLVEIDGPHVVLRDLEGLRRLVDI